MFRISALFAAASAAKLQATELKIEEGSFFCAHSDALKWTQDMELQAKAIGHTVTTEALKECVTKNPNSPVWCKSIDAIDATGNDCTSKFTSSEDATMSVGGKNICLGFALKTDVPDIVELCGFPGTTPAASGAFFVVAPLFLAVLQ